MSLPEIEFELRIPATKRQLERQVRRNLWRGLPEVHGWAQLPGPLRIIANGPSAKQAPLTGRTMALNGALRLFTDKGLAPTFWAACDPQPIVAEFVANAPKETVYLVASKCHPSVFKALKGREVHVWHVSGNGAPKNRPLIPTAVSITLCAMTLARWMGYRDLETWGWDGCYIDGQDHAVPQPHNAEDINIEIGERTFHSTPTWGVEGQDAGRQFTRDGYRPRIMGDGMFASLLDYRLGRVAPAN